MQRSCDAVGLRRSRHDLAVSSGPARSYFITGPRLLAKPGSSSRTLFLRFRVLTAPHPPEILSNLEHLPWGFLPHRDISIQSPPSGELPSLTFVPSSAFLALSTACSSRYLAGLFHPTATSGIHSSGDCSRCQADPTHRRAVPSCRLTTLASSRVAPTVQLRPSRLQGFDPGSDPLRRTDCLGLPTARSPLEFSLPRASLRPPW